MKKAILLSLDVEKKHMGITPHFILLWFTDICGAYQLKIYGKPAVNNIITGTISSSPNSSDFKLCTVCLDTTQT